MFTHHVVPLDRGAPRLRVTSLGVPSPFADSRVAWCAVRFESADTDSEKAGTLVQEAVAPEAMFHVALPPQLVDAAPRRIASYLAGRYCAEQALRRAGYPAPIPVVGRASSGGPVWPMGWVGSISHTDEECVAVCARTSVVSSLGIDCERIVSREVAEEIGATVAPEVHNGTAALGGLDQPVALTLAFSAKEALFKALFAQVGVFFGFEVAQLVRINPENVTLELQLVSDLSADLCRGRRFTLRYVHAGDAVITALALVSAPEAA